MPPHKEQEKHSALLRELLTMGQSVVVRARGHSMWPLLRDGDRLIVAPAPGHARIGEVLVYISGNNGVTAHRVLKRYRSDAGVSYRVQGDAEGGEGEIIRASQVLGIAMAVERNGRRTHLHTVAARLGGIARVALAKPLRCMRKKRPRSG